LRHRAPRVVVGDENAVPFVMARTSILLVAVLAACTSAPGPDGPEDAGAPNCTVEVDVDTGGPYEALCDPETEYCFVDKEGGQNSVRCVGVPACDAGDVCDCLLAPFSDPIFAGSSCVTGDDGLVRLERLCCVD
jgi:hypothetical protein